ncbi:MAG: TlpA disulfide reductase family protein, partial [Gammaproteobacteria bacterium]|nr:TlpA disulfide reductase family protein [Gammaproteobacteria bacterium]
MLCLILVQPLAAQQVVPELGHTLTALPAPMAGASFTLQDTDEETHALEDYRGKVILLNFWATWCPPCRREIPSMERLYQLLKEE